VRDTIAAMSNVDDYIDEITDWRGDTLLELRALISKTAPELAEDFKWGVPVWTGKNGLVCAISAFKDHVKINFFKGAYLPDPENIINNGLESKEHRSIDFNKDDTVNKIALAELIKQAATLSS
jgi:hypothetical protein